jgi:hypothetical protein
MIIKEQFIEFVPDAISSDGDGIRLTAIEIKHEISKKYGMNWNSVIPSDYCNNDGEER